MALQVDDEVADEECVSKANWAFAKKFNKDEGNSFAKTSFHETTRKKEGGYDEPNRAICES